jgi:hypothetical protein
MVNLTSLQNKINTKIFDGLGTTLLVESAVTSTLTPDKWGDTIKTYATVGSIVAVPWSHMQGVESMEPFGELEIGSVDMAFKYNQTLDIGYRITLGSEYYFIKELEEFPLLNGVLVKVARLKKTLQ